MIHIIDTFKDFKICFEDNLNLSIDEKLIYGKKLIFPSIQSLKENVKKTMSSMDIAGGK